MMKKILFAKVPSAAKVPLASYDLNQFYPMSTSPEPYDCMFQDYMGEVYATPFSEDEWLSGWPEFDINKYFGIDVDVLKDVTIAFFNDTSNGRASLMGWYSNAEIHKHCQHKTPFTRGFHFKTRAKSAVWLPGDPKVITELDFEDFIYPPDPEAEKIADCIAGYSGAKCNLVFDDVLQQIFVSRVCTPEQCIEECEAVYASDDRTPKDIFQVIKKCEQALRDFIPNEHIYGLLADSYKLLEQYELWIKSSEMQFKLNPSYDNKMSYALSLYLTVLKAK